MHRRTCWTCRYGMEMMKEENRGRVNDMMQDTAGEDMLAPIRTPLL